METQNTIGNDKKWRQFKPTFAALKNKNTIYILTVFLAFAGFMSFNSMQRELFPEIVVPYIMVQTPYPGNSPLDIENLITRPIEKELKGLSGVKRLSSASFQDVSTIMVEFETDVEVDKAKQDVKDKVDNAKSELPDDLLEDPMINDIDFSEIPVLNVNLSGDYSVTELKVFAELLQDEFETLQEVRRAEVRGIDEREIKVHVDPHRLEAYNLSFFDIESALRSENVTIGSGEVVVDATRRSIRTEADYKSMNEIERTIVKKEDDHVVYVRDVAEVIDGFEEKSTISRLNNQPVVTLSVIKKGGENLLDATDKIFKIINENQKNNSLPKDLKITVTDDQSVSIKDQISNLLNSIWMGMIFVIIVLYIFMGLRNAIFSGLAIPMSMAISFWVLSQMGFTINTMVLFGLVLALGMLVDNAIVVIENVYRLYENGYTKIEATKHGVSEIAIPIISSTATTLAVFFPLLLWPGIVGKFMSFLPVTLIVVLSSSLFVALILNPVFGSQFMKIEDITKKANHKKLFTVVGALAIVGVVFHILGSMLWGNLFIIPLIVTLFNLFALKPFAVWFQHKGLPYLESKYEATLRMALGRKTSLIVFSASILLFFFSILFFGMMKPNVIFFPENEPRTIFATVELPLGSDIERTNEVSQFVEDSINRIIEPYREIVKSITVNVGTGKGGFFESSQAHNKSLISITFLDYQYRKGFSTSKIMKEISDNLQGFVHAKVFVEKEHNGPPVGKPINIEISGNDYEKLILVSEKIRDYINEDKIQGIENLELDINTNKPEMRLNIDREKVRRFGLSTQLVAGTLRNALYGSKVDTYKDGEDEFDIMLRLKDEYRNNVASLMDMKIKYEKNGKGYFIPISTVASYEYSTTYETINRNDNMRVITIYSNVVEGYNQNQINDRIRSVLEDYEMPQGYKWKMTGEQENQKETSDFLVMALFMGVALIAMILITQFNSAVKPLIIIGTVALSTIGVFMGLGTFQMDFIILMTGVGIVSLAGIVVNNGIVLIDYIDIVRTDKKLELTLKEGERLSIQQEIDCIVEGGKTRLRPVLLTAITTVLGLIPLATGLNFDFYGLLTELNPHIYFGGDNADFWSPMAWTVIFGLSTSTVLTLIMAPVMYFIAIRLRNGYNRVGN